MPKIVQKKKERKKNNLVRIDTPNRIVRKTSEFIQQGRFDLDKNQFKALSFIISLIQKEDTVNTVYSFDCRSFLNSIGYRSDCPLQIARDIVQQLAGKRWWIEDKKTKKGILAGWIDLAETDSDTKVMNLTFHKTLSPFLFDLIGNKNEYITRYDYTFISRMRKDQSPRLYELLKSYSNHGEWTFEFNTDSERDLRVILGKQDESSTIEKRVVFIPKSWNTFTFFKRDILDPAVKEINELSDIRVSFEGLKYDLGGNKCRKITTVKFNIENAKDKNPELNIVDEVISEEPTQISLEDMFPQFDDSKSEAKEYFKAKDEALANSRYPAVRELLYDECDEAKVIVLVDTLREKISPDRIIENCIDNWAYEIINHYWKKILATPENTKSKSYFRLLSDLNYDNDKMIDRKSEWENNGI